MKEIGLDNLSFMQTSSGQELSEVYLEHEKEINEEDDTNKEE